MVGPCGGTTQRGYVSAMTEGYPQDRDACPIELVNGQWASAMWGVRVSVHAMGGDRKDRYVVAAFNGRETAKRVSLIKGSPMLTWTGSGWMKHGA